MFGLSRSACAGTSTGALISPATGALQQLLQHGLDTARGASALLEAGSGASRGGEDAAATCGAASPSPSWAPAAWPPAAAANSHACSSTASSSSSGSSSDSGSYSHSHNTPRPHLLASGTAMGSWGAGPSTSCALGAAAAAAAAASGAALQLQQARSYRIPYKVLLPKTPYSERSGRPAPRPAPELLPVKGAPAGGGGGGGGWAGGGGAEGAAAEVRWHRSVVRFPTEVTAELEGGDGDGSSSGGGGGGRVLVVSGKAGSVRLDLQELDPTGLLAFRLIHLPPPPSASSPSSSSSPAPAPSKPGKPAPSSSSPSSSPSSPSSSPSSQAAPRRSLLALVSPDRGVWEAAAAALNGAIRGVMAGYLVGLAVKGVGYRLEPAELEGAEAQAATQQLSVVAVKRRSRAPGGATPKPYYFESPNAPGAAAAGGAGKAGGDKGGGKGGAAIAFPYNKPASAIRLKVGYSRPVVYPLPPHVRAFFLKPTLLYLYGLELGELQRVAAEVRSIRPPNAYTGNGLTYVDEVVRLKARKGAK